MDKIKKKSLKHAIIISFLICLASLLFGSLLYRFLSNREERELNHIFNVATKNQFDALERHFYNGLSIVNAAHVFFSASEYVSRDEFTIMTYNFLRKTNALKHLFWIPSVPYRDRKTFEQAARRKGIEGFQFIEKGDVNTWVRSPDKPFHFPVYYMEPYADVDMKMGFDLSSEDMFMKTITQSQITGNAEATRAFHMLEGNQYRLMFFLCQPVYKKDAVVFIPKGRLEGFLGVVAAVFKYPEFVEEALADSWVKETSFFLFDNCVEDSKSQLVFLSNPDSKIFWSNISDFNNIEPGNLMKLFKGYKYVNMRQFDFAGRKWTMISAANPAFIDRYLTMKPFLMFLIVILMGIVAVLLLLFVFRRNFSIEVEVRNRTKALNALKEELEKSRQQYMLAVEGSQDGIWDWDLRSNELFLSAKWKEMLGYTDDELENKYSTFFDLLHPEDKPRVESYLDKYLNGGMEYYNIEFRMRHKNGNYLNILSKGEAVRDNNGIPYRMAGSHTNITERKIKEKELIRSETKFRTLYNSNSEAIMVLDEHKFLDCNDQTVKLFRFNTKADFLSKHPKDVSPEKQLCGTSSGEKADYYIKKAMREGSVRFEWVHRKANGVDFLAEVLLDAMEIDGKTVLQAIVRDISQSKQAEEEMKQTVEELERFNRIMLERESRILELKKEINTLLLEAGKEIKYKTTM